MSISFKYKIAFFHGEVFYFNVDIKMLELLPFRYTHSTKGIDLMGGHIRDFVLLVFWPYLVNKDNDRPNKIASSLHNQIQI